MEQIVINFNYRGAEIEASVFPDENFLGMIYPVELNGKYAFTLFSNEEEEWSVMRESDGLVPDVDMDIIRRIVKHLEMELPYAA